MTRKTEITDNFQVDFGNIIADAQSLVGDLLDSKKSPKLVLDIDATHSGRLTNNRVYPGPKVRDSVSTWLKPQARPVLKNHNDMDDPIGRVTSAKFVQLKDGKSFEQDFRRPSAGVGSGFIQLGLEIMDQDAIEKFVDGRFREFSTRQSFDSFMCSYCGQDMAKDFCGHFPGDTVVLEGKKGKADTEFKVFGITGNLTYREVSVVNIPGDAFTKINEMELVGVDSLGGSNDVILTCNDSQLKTLNGFYLTDSAGEELVDLVSDGDRTRVTAEDRKRLTNKTIIAVGPMFDQEKIMDNDQNTEEEVLDQNENIEQSVEDQTSDQETDKPVAEDTQDQEQEDVVVPAKETEASESEGSEGSDNDDERIVKDALTARIKTMETDAKAKDSEIARLKGQAAETQEALDAANTRATETAAQLKESFARTLLDSRIILGRTEVADSNAYSEALTSLCERSLDSLQDAISDLTPELVAFKASVGVPQAPSIEDEKVENPVANSAIEDKEETKEDDDDQEEKRPISRSEFIDNI